MASPCGGTGLVTSGRCPQCKGSPNSDPECALAGRRSLGQGITKVWESDIFMTGPGLRTVRHPLRVVPADVRVSWERPPRIKAAMAGQPESQADYQITHGARTTEAIEITVTSTTGSEPGSYRLIVLG